MPLLDLPETRSTENRDSTLLKKVAAKSTQTMTATTFKGGKGLITQIANIKTYVDSVFSNFDEKYTCIRDEQMLISYIDKCVAAGMVAVDTESDGLNPLVDDIAGVGLYSKGLDPVYIPVGHKSYITGTKVQNQLSIEFVGEQLKRLTKTKNLFSNAKYDKKVILEKFGVYLPHFWDTQVAGKLLDENNPVGLKPLHERFIMCGTGVTYKFDELFEGVPFCYVPIDVGYKYAARDPKMTWELSEFQMGYIGTKEAAKANGLEGLHNAYYFYEHDIIDVLCAMEMRGIYCDKKKGEELSIKWHKKLDIANAKFFELLKEYKVEIDKYNVSARKDPLPDPINLASPKQLATLFYDILKLKSPDKKKPRGTGEEIISKWDLPLCDALLEVRGIEKLLGTYIDKLPAVAHTDGRIHGNFNQTGTVTGRFSSDDPNLQNIPAHGEGVEVRNIFAASDGNYLIGCDYSQQEPRILAYLSGDRNLLEAYEMGKDVYAWSASLVFNKPYDECREFYPDGSENKQGKKIRAQMKAIILGIMYGKQVPAIAEDLKITKKEAKRLFDSFFGAFPKVKSYLEDTQNFARENGYVETVCGRKRRLPDMMLSPYEFNVDPLVYGKDEGYDPTNFDELPEDVAPVIEDEVIDFWVKKLESVWGWQAKQEVIKQAAEQGILITDNSLKVSDAERQCVNSVIQGSAAEITKRAMIKVHQSEELKALGYNLLLSIHDELIGECPIENVKQAKEIKQGLMIAAAEEIIQIAMKWKCDVVVSKCWEGDKIAT